MTVNKVSCPICFSPSRCRHEDIHLRL